MKKGVVLPLALLVLAAAAPSARADAWRVPKGKTWTWSFAADTLGHAPDGSHVLGGRWIVVLDSTRAPEAAARVDSSEADSSATGDSTAAAWPRVLRQAEDNDGVVFHMIQLPKPLLHDLEISVRFRIRSGEIDPTAGVAFQLDPKGRNGYVVRVSGEKSELMAHYLLSGKRRDLKYEKIDRPEAGAWHTLEIRRVGATMDVSYDGKPRFRLRDERYQEGTIGLWTEDDTIADFADLTVRSL